MPRIIRNDNDEVEEVGANASREGGGEEKQSMKKGPWTAAEDAILIEYVKKYGEGNWNSVQRNSGLSRCGKSCRLRWANHLRPNLKKGAFSQEEEQIIIELHAKLGNKWARMASQLPGRTDNEIKNFWNTRMKRRQRAGLPLYPPEVQDEAALYHLHQHQQYFAPPHPSSFSFSSLLSSSNYRQKLNELNYSSAANQSDSAYDQQFKFSNKNNGNLGLPLSSFSPYGSSSSTLLNHSFATHSAAAADSHDYQSGTYKYDFNSSAVVPGLNTTEISSSQSPPGSETPASSYTSGVHGLMGASSIAMDYYEVAPLSPEGNSGLLDALVMEAQALSRSDNKSKSEDSTAAGKLSLKRKRMEVEHSTEEEDPVPVELAMKNGGDTTAETQRDDLSSSQLSTGKKPIADKDPFMEEMNSMDDDLFSLLNNFPSEMPMPEWYRKGERQSLEIENRQDASPGPTDQELAWTLGTCWNNMPRIC